jgi:hypothetical protein
MMGFGRACVIVAIFTVHAAGVSYAQPSPARPATTAPIVKSPASAPAITAPTPDPISAAPTVSPQVQPELRTESIAGSELSDRKPSESSSPPLSDDRRGSNALLEVLPMIGFWVAIVCASISVLFFLYHLVAVVRSARARLLDAIDQAGASNFAQLGRIEQTLNQLAADNKWLSDRILQIEHSVKENVTEQRARTIQEVSTPAPISQAELARRAAEEMIKDWYSREVQEEYWRGKGAASARRHERAEGYVVLDEEKTLREAIFWIVPVAPDLKILLPGRRLRSIVSEIVSDGGRQVGPTFDGLFEVDRNGSSFVIAAASEIRATTDPRVFQVTKRGRLTLPG